MNPANEKQYRFDNEWIDLEEKTITLHIKGVPSWRKAKSLIGAIRCNHEE
jgi:acyl-homoserine lactone acylase PvdQ